MEKKEKKNRNGLVIAFVIETIVILALVGYILIDKEIILSSKTTDNEINNTAIEETTSKNTVVDINENEDLKFYFYVSATKDFYRYSLTIKEASSDEKSSNGYFEIGVLNRWEGPSASGYYYIENNKITFKWMKNVSDSVNEGVFNMMKATYTDDATAENYYAYTTDYNDDAITLGNISLQKVN
jgi:hypothetical protein